VKVCLICIELFGRGVYAGFGRSTPRGVAQARKTLREVRADEACAPGDQKVCYRS
jgi:hypothetical protein